MKRLRATALAICLMVLTCTCSCAYLQKADVPAGCEDALSYKVLGFLPLGPVLIRTGFYTIAVMVPNSKPALKGVVETAQIAIQAGNLVEAVEALAKVFLSDAIPQNVALVIWPGVENVLKLQIFLNASQATTINACDVNIWMSLCNNILADLEAL